MRIIQRTYVYGCREKAVRFPVLVGSLATNYWSAFSEMIAWLNMNVGEMAQSWYCSSQGFHFLSDEDALLFLLAWA